MGKIHSEMQSNRDKRFHWVNKTSKSAHLSRSTATETQDIRRFIQHSFTACRQRRRTHMSETIWKVSLKQNGCYKYGLREAPDTGYEAFNSRLCRWRVISPKLDCARKAEISVRDRSRTASPLFHEQTYSQRSRPERGAYDTAEASRAFEEPSDQIPTLHQPKGSAWVMTHAKRLGVDSSDCYGFFHLQEAWSSPTLPIPLPRPCLSQILHWAKGHDDVFLGTVLSHQCWKMYSTPAIPSLTARVEALRTEFLRKLDARLLAGVINEVLVQVIMLAIDVDTYLGREEYLDAHTRALWNIVRYSEHVKGFDVDD